MKLVWIFAFVPLCFGAHEVTEETCMNVGNSYPINFTSLVNGSTLNVCSQYLQDELQCCSQSDEDVLGMRLNSEIRNDVTLGSELQALQANYESLITALSNVQSSLINDVLRPLMNYSVDREVQYSFDDLDRIRDEILDKINGALLGTMDTNLTEEVIRYFTEGISGFYFNFTFNIGAPGNSLTLTDSEMACAIDAIYEYLFPPVEQAKIASLGNNLQQIAVTYEVARAVMSGTLTILTELEIFDTTPTCTNVWTEQYACPLCAGQTTPLCEGRCNEILIGCMSSLQQVTVQLNVLLDFVRASVSSLISGDPYDNINVHNIGDNYTSAFATSLSNSELLLDVIDEANCGIGTKKRSVDYYLVRHKRQRNVVFPTVTIDQSTVTMISDTLLPAVMNVSLANDHIALCDFEMANGPSTNCTIGVNAISPYMSTFDSLEISDQAYNPAGNFNLTQLREQARPLTYVVTELLTNRSDIMMLYENVLPGRDIPNLDFLNEPRPSPTISMSVTPTASDMPGPMQSGGTTTVSLSLSITDPTTTPTTTIAPSSTVIMTRPTQTGSGATAVSFSLFIMLVALLFVSVL